ncbi:division plane positioning ATPase MipZ [Algicella marina]|uniref:AAA family ATPase n=1 Tax=Algicella marina TaxID=2683284 RepID=A0A6P1STN4_9RHOB|nr:division plane positioning ATPase MipZ [Algicella marina]QHQ33788.1 AAA family ATPase [Algicella marina]
MAHIIVLGNEKGGTGKSTTAMHVTTALLHSGYPVGIIDLDLRQESLMNHARNRDAFVSRKDVSLPLPVKAELAISSADSLSDAQAEEESRFADALDRLDKSCRFIVIDCPGAHTRYAQMAHSAADTLITPLNDSMVDLGLLAKVDAESGKVLGPSIYAEMVWSARSLRATAGLIPVDWVVLRNRMSTLNARNKRRVGSALDDLSKRIGFRLIPGFSERVVFRELYLQGLTLLDLKAAGQGPLTMSQIAARQELRELMRALRLPDVTLNF